MYLKLVEWKEGKVEEKNQIEELREEIKMLKCVDNENKMKNKRNINKLTSFLYCNSRWFSFSSLFFFTNKKKIN